MRTNSTDHLVELHKLPVSSILTRRQLGLLAITLLLFMSGCVTVDVINVSELNARVLIRLPDAPGGYTRLIHPGESTSTFSNHGGGVTIQTLPDEQYRQLLESLRGEITRRLFEERAALSAADIARLVRNLEDIESQIAQMADDGASCTVNAPEFSSVTAVLSWDSDNGKWSLSCSVAAEEN
jgi:hypothetical protein